jgi:hypothetical protein
MRQSIYSDSVAGRVDLSCQKPPFVERRKCGWPDAPFVEAVIGPLKAKVRKVRTADLAERSTNGGFLEQ